MYKWEFLNQAMLHKQLVGFSFKNLEYMHHFHNIVQSNLLDLHYYYPIANIHYQQAADAVYISNNELNFIQLKTRQSYNKFYQPIFYQQELDRYYGYCNTLQFAFLDKKSFLINTHIENKIDLSYLFEESNQDWENFVNLNLKLYQKKHSLVRFNYYNQLHNNIYENKNLFYGKRYYE